MTCFHRLRLVNEDIQVDERYFNFYKTLEKQDSSITVANFNEDLFVCLDQKLRSGSDDYGP